MNKFSKILLFLFPLLLLSGGVFVLGQQALRDNQTMLVGYEINFTGFEATPSISATYQSYDVEEKQEFILSEKDSIIFNHNDPQYKVFYRIGNNEHQLVEFFLDFNNDILNASIIGLEPRDVVNIPLNGVPFIKEIRADWAGRLHIDQLYVNEEICFEMSNGSFCHAKHNAEVSA